MGVLNELSLNKKWHYFLDYKIAKSHISKREEAYLRNFIECKHYKTVTDNILKSGFNFSIPEKRFLNRHGKGKKRAVYTFSESENTVLKLVSFLLYRYDDAQSRNCYSFRRNYGAKKAIANITKEKDIVNKYSCKLDIKDYFNSIDVELLLPILCKLLSDDKPLYRFFEKLLSLDKAVLNGEIITEKRGAMAGIPVSQFFANVYLTEMDLFFMERGILYARYSDDIIFFADSYETLMGHFETAKSFLARYHLKLNPEKTRVTGPNEKWDYLGITFDNGRIGLSPATMKKIKGKIRRKARSIYRWKLRKEADDKRAMRVFSRALNRKFFGRGSDDDFTWARWFFPLITEDSDLKTIDAYAQEHMRYVKSGRFSRANYRTRYSELKDNGYISLVNKYHSYKKQRFAGASSPKS